ncbi:hypothetical protein [Streptomyces sp. 135]|uniref:hypothetical protein n=1 Tax=Streptomyces sp. 135 TaxID=2838850 RepID=UPI001CBBE28F|nr:hypothetical protein [Streptomyces sp. 135]
MAFPLDIRTEFHLAGAWTDVSPDVYVRDQKVISRGRRDQGATTDPSSLSLTLNNRGGRYSPRNAMSPLYGLIGRNTRVRVSVPSPGTPYLQMEPDSGQHVTTPDGPALDVSAALDVRAEIAPNWYGPQNQTLIGKWDAAAGQRSWLLRVDQGRLYFTWSGDGSQEDAWFASRPLPVLPETAAVRVTWEADNGAGQRQTRFYWAESLAGPWTEFASRSLLSDVPTIFNGTAPLSIGPSDLSLNPSAYRLPFSGRGYRFEVRNGVTGPVVASPDFTAQAAGATSFTDSAGCVWTLSGGAEIREREDRFLGEISSWPMEWALDGSDIWTPVQASGIMRRLGQGQKPFDSTLRRRIPSGNPVAYWPLEDEGAATRAYSPVHGVDPAALTGVEFASLDSLPSSSPLPRLTAAASLSAKIPGTMASGAWQVEFVYAADDKPPADYTELISFSSPNGTVRRWVIALKKGTARITGYGSGTNTVALAHLGIGDDVFHGWMRLRFWARDEGDGTVRWRIDWKDVGGDAGGFTDTCVGAAGRLSFLTANWGAAMEGWGIGHLTVLDTANSTLMDGSDDAYHGETAWERLRRLADEERLPLSRIPGRLTPERVGYQRRDTILNLLDAAAQADGGMLLEDPRRVGLIYRDRSSLYSQYPVLTLSYTAPGLGPDLQPVDDDSAVRNDITVTRDGGGAGRAFLAEGPLSVQVPPHGIGRYDEALTLSLAHDTQTEPAASWRLHLGTFDGARYPTVSVTVHKPGAETHVPAILGLREGDLIRLTGLPPWVAHGDVDLIVEGWTETLDLYRWTLVFNCSPGGPWRTALVNVVTEDFEDLNYALPLTSAGALPWVRSSAQAHTGTWSLKSGAITNNQTSDAVLTIPANATELSFWYFTSSEAAGAGFTGDYLTVLADGVEVLRAQGATPWTRKTLDVSSTKTVTFRYRKDNSAAAGADAVWIDNLRLVLGQQPVAKVDTDGSSLVSAVTATSTTLTVTSAGLPWTTSVVDMPIPIEVGGEVMSVTAVSGTTSPQAFTVVRSVNGVTKPHQAGASIRLAFPAVVPL